MSNYDLPIGSAFLHQSLYEIARLQIGRQERVHPANKPLPFKVFQKTAFYPLSQSVPLTLGDARWSFPAFRQEQQNHCSPPSLEKLGTEQISTLLYYTYGFSRYDTGSGVMWPFHRFVASARCFFPTELYLWLPQMGHVPAGIYHYDSLHHGLDLIRLGNYRDLFCDATDTDLQGCLGILIFSSLFWKTAFKYINFAYRLCTQEAGIVVGNALMIAGAMGLRGSVYYQFLDRVLNHLLGLEPGEESVLAMVPLYPGEDKVEQKSSRLWKERTSQSMLERTPSIGLRYYKAGSLNRELCARLIELDQHTFLENTREIVTSTMSHPLECVPTEERIAPPLQPIEPAELAQALHHRSSGDAFFAPLRQVLPKRAFWEIVRYALSEYRSDLSLCPASPHLQLFIVVNHVAGLEQGLYRFCACCHMLHVIERGDFTLPFQAVQMRGNIASATANLLCFLAGDYKAASRTFGNRAYRLLNQEAGIIGHRISVMSAVHGLAARYSNSYEPTQCRTLLGLASSPLVVFAELVIGYEAPGASARERYRLSLRA